MDDGALHAAVFLGILLFGSLVAGLIADIIRLPKVTAYLLAGMLLGPCVLHWVPKEQVHHMEPLTKLAMALVLLELGCQFPLARLRHLLKRVFWISAAELSLTFALVALGLWAIGCTLGQATLLGALAIATAPATTVLVLQESDSEGPVTELAGLLVTLNNLAVIVVFELTFLALQVYGGQLENGPSDEIKRLTLDLFGAIGLGVLGGIVVGYGVSLLSQRRWLVLIIAVTLLLLGLCESWDLPYMLTFLVVGAVVVNTTGFGEEINKELGRISGLLVVVFFVVHGAELDLAAFIASGTVGLVYILTRSSGKYFGCAIAATLTHQQLSVRRWLGTTLLAQAGVAIALSSMAAERNPDLGKFVQTIILGSVVVFEIVGPILTRLSVVRAGEVPLAQAIRHRTIGPLTQFIDMWSRLRSSVGLKPKASIDFGSVTIGNLMRSNVEGIPQTADFDTILSFIQRSRDNTYPVIDDLGCVVGIIHYELLSDAFFDPALESLVRAEDLATQADFLVCSSDPLGRALEIFRKTADDCIPVVVSVDSTELVGIIRRTDVTNLLIRKRNPGASASSH